MNLDIKVEKKRWCLCNFSTRVVFHKELNLFPHCILSLSILFTNHLQPVTHIRHICCINPIIPPPTHPPTQQELLSLENNMKELRDLFMDIFMLVEEQGAYIEHIQTNVERTQDYVAASNEKFKLAARYKKKNPLRQLCCCCCPPWRCCL